MTQGVEVEHEEEDAAQEHQAEEDEEDLVGHHLRVEVAAEPVQAERPVQEHLNGSADGEREGDAQHAQEHQRERQLPEALIEVLDAPDRGDDPVGGPQAEHAEGTEHREVSMAGRDPGAVRPDVREREGHGEAQDAGPHHLEHRRAE